MNKEKTSLTTSIETYSVLTILTITIQSSISYFTLLPSTTGLGPYLADNLNCSTNTSQLTHPKKLPLMYIIQIKHLKVWQTMSPSGRLPKSPFPQKYTSVKSDKWEVLLALTWQKLNKLLLNLLMMALLRNSPVLRSNARSV